MVRPIPRSETASRSERTAEELIQRILAGRWRPGEALPPERELAAELGVSRATLREALRRLQSLGLVRSHHGSGTRVAPWHRTGSFDLLPYYLRHTPDTATFVRLLGSALQLRRTLLGEALRWLAERPEADLERLEGLVVAAESRRGTAEFVAADLELVRALLEESGFVVGLWLLNQFLETYEAFVAALPHLPEPPASYATAWRSALRHAHAGEVEAAVAALDAYFTAHDQRLFEELTL